MNAKLYGWRGYTGGDLITTKHTKHTKLYGWRGAIREEDLRGAARRIYPNKKLCFIRVGGASVTLPEDDVTVVPPKQGQNGKL